MGIPEPVDVATAKSLGLRLVALQVRQLSGRIDILRENGAKIVVEYPVS